jgi:formyltetrahydrofolate deformylase
MFKEKETAVLLFTCPDQEGIVYHISNFIHKNGGNIIDLNEHVDRDEKLFFIRVEWEIGANFHTLDEIEEAFKKIAGGFSASWEIKLAQKKTNIALFVSKYDHCLNEILWRYQLGEFPVNISLIVSNHTDLQDTAKHYNIPYYHFPLTQNNRDEMEIEELVLLKEKNIDTVVLARYMQIISQNFINAYPNQIINIHHSFLPAFIGGNPYKQAYQRGVKIIGATSHYVTADLDQGPIIEQDIIRITHKDSLKDLIRKGRDLERLVLARALHHHFEHRVLVHGSKTIIFD